MFFDTWPETALTEVDAISAQLCDESQVLIGEVAVPNRDAYHRSLVSAGFVGHRKGGPVAANIAVLQSMNKNRE